MNAQTERLTLHGSAGAIEALRDSPAPGVAVRGVAVIAHPHPLFGGTMDNKVVQTLARAFVACGYVAVRFNFRGVGASAGVHDAGQGECEDLLAVVQQVAPQGPLALAGFSFGAFVTSHALAALVAARQRTDTSPVAVALIGSLTSVLLLFPRALSFNALPALARALQQQGGVILRGQGHQRRVPEIGGKQQAADLLHQLDDRPAVRQAQAAADAAERAALNGSRAATSASRAESAALRAESFAPEDGTLLSVNGKGGAVVLDAQDVGALPAPVAPQAGAFLRVLSIRSDGSLVVDTVTPAALKTLLEAT